MCLCPWVCVCVCVCVCACVSRVCEQAAVNAEADEYCKGEFGPYARFDGVDSCECIQGYTVSDAGTCIPEKRPEMKPTPSQPSAQPPSRGLSSAGGAAGGGVAGAGGAVPGKEEAEKMLMAMERDPMQGPDVAAHYREQWAGYDVNGDGVISMEENLAVDKQQAEMAGAGVSLSASLSL